MKANTLVQKENLAIPSKVSLNFLIIYPPINIPVATVGKVMVPRNKGREKDCDYINTVILKYLYKGNTERINQIHPILFRK